MRAIAGRTVAAQLGCPAGSQLALKRAGSNVGGGLPAPPGGPAVAERG
eukprot:SAG31_NODE_313_length_17858_cov_34.811307_13_plen_48_part_00